MVDNISRVIRKLEDERDALYRTGDSSNRDRILELTQMIDDLRAEIDIRKPHFPNIEYK